MLAEKRIVHYRLLKKLEDNPSYAQQIGVSVELRKAEPQRKDIRQKRENDFQLRGGIKR